MCIIKSVSYHMKMYTTAHQEYSSAQKSLCINYLLIDVGPFIFAQKNALDRIPI